MCILALPEAKLKKHRTDDNCKSIKECSSSPYHLWLMFDEKFSTLVS